MGKVLGVTDPAKIMGLANIARVMGTGGFVVETHDGASFWPTYPGLIALDGSAAIRFEGVDISPFAGVAGSSTPYRIDLYDSSLELLSGYLAEVDGVEALGTDAVTNGDCEAAAAVFDDDANVNCSYAQNNEEAHAGSNSAKIIRTAAGLGYSVREISDTDLSVITAGQLYEMTFWIYVPTQVGISVNYYYNDGGGNKTPSDSSIADRDTWVSRTIYVIPNTALNLLLQIYGAQNVYFYIDDISIKPVTNLGTDGCHVVSAKNGSTQNWASKSGSFDYNDASGYTFNIVST